jgi:AcrR family transcriptional regulator
MDDKITGASLSPEVTPRKFKFTSQQGRSRRTQLLTATRELLRELTPEEVTFAMVCERADIPRASAYHFFPNINALFLGLRLWHSEVLAENIAAVQADRFEAWQDYMTCLIGVGAQITREDPALMRLNYGMPGGISEARQIGKSLDVKILSTALENLEHRFVMPDWPDRERVMAITFTIIDSIFRLSFREQGEITDEMVREAGRASISYLRCYLPEYIEVRAARRDP